MTSYNDLREDRNQLLRAWNLAQREIRQLKMEIARLKEEEE